MVEQASRPPIFDGLMPWGNLDHPECMEEAQQGGVTAANITVAHYPHNTERAKHQISKYAKVIEARAETMFIVRDAADINKAHATRRVGVIFGFQDSTPFENRLDTVKEFADLGVRIVQLTYNTQNFVGSGCCETFCGPLSDFGRELIRELEENRIAIDLSHCSDETTDDALARARRPMLFTHSGARSVCPAYGRNKTDDQIRRLADTGGVIGVCLAPFLLRREPGSNKVVPVTLNDVVDHIAHIAELVGIEHVGFGSDLCAAWLRQHRTPPESSLRWWRPARPDVFGEGPTDYYDPYPPGLTDHSQVGNLAAALAERGFTQADIDLVMGGNFIRVLGEIWRN